MVISNVTQLIECRNLLLKERKRLKDAYIDSKTKINRETIEKKLKEVEIKLGNLKSIMIYTTRFETDKFVHFLRDFLILTERNVVSTELTVTSQDSPNSDTKEIKCYFVCDEGTAEMLRKRIYTKEQLIRYLKNNKPDDVTFFQGNIVYPFTDNYTMMRKFTKYPRLKDAIYELMQLKMDDPTLSEDDRYRIVLGNTVRRNLERSSANYQKKKKL